MLMPSRTRRSLIAHFIAPIVRAGSRRRCVLGQLLAGGRRPAWSRRIDSLCHVKYLRHVNHPVNMDGSTTRAGSTMRFALMIEPQMGLTYDEQLADRPARRGGRLRDPVPVRPLRELPGRESGGRRPTPGRSSPGLARDTTRIGLGVLVSPVTFRTPGQPRQGRGRRSDEMSGGRVEVGVGAGWHEDEHRRHGFPFPEIGERAEHARGDAGDPPRAVGRAGRLVVHRPRTTPSRTRCSGPSRASLPGRDGGRPQHPRRRRRGRRARSGSRPATRTSSTCPRRARDGRGAEVRAARRRAAGRRAATRRRWSTR